MNFNKKNIYSEVDAFTNTLINKISTSTSKSLEQVNCYDVEKYVTENEDVEFLDYPFEEKLRNLYWGSIINVGNSTTITTASHLKKEIKNFTKMHEIIHYYFDHKNNTSNDSGLKEIPLKKGYFREDLPKEFRANKGAGMLLINKKALKYAFSTYDDLEKMASFFNVNDIVLKIRIIDELIYSHNLSYKQANLIYNGYYFQQQIQLKEILFK